MHALTRPCLPPAWPRRASHATRPRVTRSRSCAPRSLLDPASLAAALTSAIGGVSHAAESLTAENAAAAVAGAVSLSAAAMTARDAASGGNGDGGGSGGDGDGDGGDGGNGDGRGGDERGRDEGDFWHRNALPSLVCALVTAALLRAHEDAAAAAFGWCSFALLLLPLPFTAEVALGGLIFVYLVRRRALRAEQK